MMSKVPPQFLSKQKASGKHDDAKMDAAQIKKMVKPAALKKCGGMMKKGK